MEEGMNLEQILKAVKEMNGLSDQDREELISSLTNKGIPGMPAPLPEPSFTHQAMVLAVMLFLVAIIFVFFGYKLIKSIKDKEKKKEEKKKQKQSKKKK